MKKWFVFGFLALGCAMIFGCGQGGGGGGETPAVLATNVTFTGTVGASASDLAQLGLSSLAVETYAQQESRVTGMVAMGFDEGSVRALKLRPLTVSNAVAVLNKVNADGTYTAVANCSLGANGSYTLTDEAYKAANAYVVTTVATSSAAGKDMYIEIYVDSTPEAGNTSATLSGNNSTPQTTLLVKLIIEKVVKEVGTNQLDPAVIKLIKTLVVNKFNSLSTSEGLNMTCVKEKGQSENTSLKNAALQSFADEVVLKAVQAIKFQAALAKGATSLETAKKIMKEIFTFITGSPDGIPSNILDAFAQAYYNGTTKKISDMTVAANKSAIKAGAPATNLYTEDNIAAGIKALVDRTYEKTTAASVNANAPAPPPAEIKTQNPLIQAVFPAAEFAGISAAAYKDKNFNVAQVILLMPVAELIASQNSAQFNPPKFCYEIGYFASTLTNKYQIMHAELKIEAFENWPGPGLPPTVQSILTSFVEAGNIINPSESGTITARLTYLKADGITSTTANYTSKSGFQKNSIAALGLRAQQEMGPPPGFKMLSLGAPWGQAGTPEVITDFKRGATATIRLYKDGQEIDSKTVTIPSVDLTNAVIAFKVPAGNKFDINDPAITTFQIDTKPTLSWTYSSGSSVDFGSLTGAYAVEVRQWDTVRNQPRFETTALYSSWHGHNFPKAGAQGQTSSITLPSIATAGAYAIMGALVGIDSGGWPVVSGPWRSTIFKIGTLEAIKASTVEITGVVTAPATAVSGTLTVGLFKMGFNTNFMGTTVTPVQVKTLAAAGGTYTMLINYTNLGTNGFGGYDTIAWDDLDSNGKLDGASNERPFFPDKHLEYHGGTLNAMDRNFIFLGPVTVSPNNTGYNIDMNKAIY